MVEKIPRHLKINFILPFIAKSGGVAVVLEHACRLMERGHDVRLYYPLLPYGAIQYPVRPPLPAYLVGQARCLLEALRKPLRAVPWFRRALRVHPLPFISPWLVRDADATFATAWPTAFDVARLPARKGEKFYFIQDYEAWIKDNAPVDASFRLPLRQVVIAPWLAALMRDRFGKRVAAEIHNGIDLEYFTPGPARDWSRPSVLLMYHRLPNKGLDDALAALKRLRAEHPGLTVRAFGVFDLPAEWSFVEYHKDPSRDALRELYRKSAIFVSASRAEGWGLPVMEAMACGCAVAATETGCVPVLADGSNMLVSPPGDAEALFLNLSRLAGDAAFAEGVAKAGLATISGHGWEKPGAEMERLLLAACGRA